MGNIGSVLVPIHREGYRFIVIFAIATALLFLVSDFLGWVGVILTLWCAYFFRDPQRITPQREGLIMSPADGVVNMIGEAVPPPELGLGLEPRLRISIFMNVFNCHVNRMPVAGQIKRILYRTGQFLSADLDKASEANERNSLLIETTDGQEIVVVQIAGLVARRIVCWAEQEQDLIAGERFGLIRFGSRVDVYLPADAVPLVAVGQSAIAGETILSDLDYNEPVRNFLSQ